MIFSNERGSIIDSQATKIEVLERAGYSTYYFSGELFYYDHKAYLNELEWFERKQKEILKFDPLADIRPLMK